MYGSQKGKLQISIAKNEIVTKNIDCDLKIQKETNIDIIKWAEENVWLDGKRFSFSSPGPLIEYGEYDKRYNKLARPYIIPFLRHQPQKKAVIKCRQSEFTINQIVENLFDICTNPYIRISHIFPTDALSSEISKEKLRPIIKNSPDINKTLLSGAIEFFEFKNGGIYSILGARRESGGRAGSRDKIVYDEKDWIPDFIEGIYSQLMSHSPWQRTRYISTPTAPNTGIDAIVKKFSEGEWWIKCQKCGLEQIMGWPQNIVNFFEVNEYIPEDLEYQKKLNNVYIGCRDCREYIDRNSVWYVKTSKWKHKKHEIYDTLASYYVNAFMIAWKTGKELLRKFHELLAYEWQFLNENIGDAFLGEHDRLTEIEIRQRCENWQMINHRVAALTNVSIGIDWGKRESYVVVIANGMMASNPMRKCIIYLEIINNKTMSDNGIEPRTSNHVYRAIQIINAFQANIIVCGSEGFDNDRHDYLDKHFKDRLWGCFFDGAESGKHPRMSKLIKPKWDKAGRKVTISKVNTIKKIGDEYRRGLIGIPVYSHGNDAIREFIKHHEGLAIQKQWSNEHNREFEIAVKLGPEHFFDGEMYASIGWEKLIGRRSTMQEPGVSARR